MQDYGLYSPLFSMGLSLCNSHPVKVPFRNSSPRASFLALDDARPIEVEETIEDYSDAFESRRDFVYAYASSSPPSSPASSIKSASPSTRSLPLPKPAPVSQLPAIPITTVSPTNSRYCKSAVPSSSIVPSHPSSSAPVSSDRKVRRHNSLAPSFFSSASVHPYAAEAQSLRSTAVSSTYRRKRRSDALAALEGRRRDGPGAIGGSFVPNMVHEGDEDDDTEEMLAAPSVQPRSAADSQPPLRSHLSLTSTVHTVPTKPASRFRYDPNEPVPQLPELPLFINSSPLPPMLKSPTSTTFPTSPRESTFAFDSSPSMLAPPRPVQFGRRASTGTTEIGWGMTFMDLDDDVTSVSTWSAYRQSMLS